MAHDIDGALGDDGPLGDDPLVRLLDDCNAHPVDFAWIQGYDFETIDCFESLAAFESASVALDEGLFDSEEDAKSYALGVGRVSSSTLREIRRTGQGNLMVLLMAVARAGYEVGVRDSFEGRLSRACKAKIAAKRNEFDRQHDELSDFHDQLREL